MTPTATPVNLTVTNLQHLMLMTQITLAVGMFNAGVLVTLYLGHRERPQPKESDHVAE